MAASDAAGLSQGHPAGIPQGLVRPSTSGVVLRPGAFDAFVREGVRYLGEQ